MKKVFEKHDLVKLAGIFAFIAIVLTWLCSYAYYQDGELITKEITRMGIFDVSTYGFLGFFYFPPMFIFIFIVAGFYKLLGNVEAYQVLTSNIANKFSGDVAKKVFVAITMFIMAALAGVVNDYFILIAIIPFFVTILSKLSVDKVTGVATTFGGVLVGILGATYSEKIVGQLVTVVGVKYGYELFTLIVLFVIAYILLLCLTLIRMNKVDKNTEALTDPFVSVEAVQQKATKKKKKVNTVPLIITLIMTFVVLILAFISWESAFGVNVFANAQAAVLEAEIAGFPIFGSLLGNVFTFGTWDLFGAVCVLLLATLLVKVLYRVSFDTILDSYADGFKTIGKTVVVLLIVYVSLQVSTVFPTIPGLVSKIMGLGTNIFTMFISGALTNAFSVEFQYTLRLIGSLFGTFENIEAAALTLQTSYGIIGFIAPTSAMLMFGLSLLNVRFSEWFKYIWKFVLLMLVVVFAVLAIVMYI